MDTAHDDFAIHVLGLESPVSPAIRSKPASPSVLEAAGRRILSPAGCGDLPTRRARSAKRRKDGSSRKANRLAMDSW